jgi:hypothetical protein
MIAQKTLQKTRISKVEDEMTEIRMSPYFDQEDPQVPIKGIIADLDRSTSYELDAKAVYKTIDKGYLFVEVSGCSCWPDRGSTSQTFCKTRVEIDKLIGDEWHELLDLCQQRNWKPEQ